MCHVIITTRSFLWTLLTILTTLAMVSSVISPYWLIGQTLTLGLTSNRTAEVTYDLYTQKKEPKTFRPTIGIFNRCTKVQQFDNLYMDNCANFVTGFNMSPEQFPNFWKAALIFFVFAEIMLIFTVVTATTSLCFRSICGKSIFTVSGLIQSIAGLFCILGLVLYPAGWGSEKLKYMCGRNAEAYTIDQCEVGWSFYVGIGGTVMVFVCAILSIQADTATSSQKVEEEILKGNTLICVI